MSVWTKHPKITALEWFEHWAGEISSSRSGKLNSKEKTFRPSRKRVDFSCFRFRMGCLQRVVENTCFSYLFFRLNSLVGREPGDLLPGWRAHPTGSSISRSSGRHGGHGSAARSRGRSRPPRLRVRRARIHNPTQRTRTRNSRPPTDGGRRGERERERGHGD